jgi:hypothetical protein
MFLWENHGKIIYKMQDFPATFDDFPPRLSNRTPRGAGGMPSRLNDPNKRLSLHKLPRCHDATKRGLSNKESIFLGYLLSIAPSKWPYFDGYEGD